MQTAAEFPSVDAGSLTGRPASYADNHIYDHFALSVITHLPAASRDANSISFFRFFDAKKTSLISPSPAGIITERLQGRAGTNGQQREAKVMGNHH